MCKLSAPRQPVVATGVLWDNLATWHRAVNDYDRPRAYRKVIAAQPTGAA